MRGWAPIFLAGLIISSLWEHLHYRLYVPLHPVVDAWYSLWLASLIDSLLIVGILYIAGKRGSLVVAGLAFLVAVAIESGALYLGIWEYRPMMPVVPILKMGLSPTLQLAVSVLFVWPIYKFLQKRGN